MRRTEAVGEGAEEGESGVVGCGERGQLLQVSAQLVQTPDVAEGRGTWRVVREAGCGVEGACRWRCSEYE